VIELNFLGDLLYNDPSIKYKQTTKSIEPHWRMFLS